MAYRPVPLGGRRPEVRRACSTQVDRFSREVAAWVVDSQSRSSPRRGRKSRSRRRGSPRLEVIDILIDAPLVALGLDGAGALEVQTDFAATGWCEPGERGPAVVAGHVDD